MKKLPSSSRTRAGEPSTRPPLVRMLRIHEELRSVRFPNCNSLGEELEVSYKTIQRDIDFMRDQWRLPIAYDQEKHGFYYTGPVSNLPTMTVSQGELVALLVAQKAVEQYRGTPFERPIASAFAKLAASLDDQEGVSIHQLAEAFSFKPASLPKAEMRAFAEAARAVLENRTVRFVYQGLQNMKKNKRRVEPYHLGCISDQWYLIGRDTERDALRTFALARIRKLETTRERFTRPPDFAIGEFLAGSFSAFQARQIESVRLRLDPLATRIAAERKWHPSQKMFPLPDGSAELTLEVGLAPDLESWILSWGARAEVLAPPALRQTIQTQLTTATALYE
jgi:predicted DNA-binding transcriptional regulator YafY